MRVLINQCVVELHQGDITDQQVDAVVNAANAALAGGGGVDGAIHRRAGPMLMQETHRLYPQGCPTGSAVITGAGNLPVKHVIHAVGPVWYGGSHGEADLLASCYRRALQLAVEHDCRSLALPALSTGAYRYPLEQASRVAISTVFDVLREQGRPELVRFVLFGTDALAAFAAALADISGIDPGCRPDMPRK